MICIVNKTTLLCELFWIARRRRITNTTIEVQYKFATI